MSLMDEFYEIANLAGAPLYYEELDQDHCYNCKKILKPDEVYRIKNDLWFCSIHCYSVVFLAGADE